jgi:hypothetical protein
MSVSLDRARWSAGGFDGRCIIVGFVTIDTLTAPIPALMMGLNHV